MNERCHEADQCAGNYRCPGRVVSFMDEVRAAADNDKAQKAS